MRDVEIVIVGQGLAGSALIWELLALRAEFVVIDRADQHSSSRVAAGLITPVTGMRLVKSWRFEEFRDAAWEFYRRVEAIAGCPLLYEGPMVRLLNSSEEEQYLERRRLDPEYTPFLRERISIPDAITAPQGGVELHGGGQLDVPGFLLETRHQLERASQILPGEVDWNRVMLAGDSVELPDWDLRCRTLVIADGAFARTNPLFPPGQFNATRGEILTVEIPDWEESRIIHGPVWIAPQRSASERGRFQVGATYDWSNLNAGPTPEGRQQLETRLQQMLNRPYRIVDHVAAVRPILRQPVPILQRSPANPAIIFWNGLASKGSLHAPYYAKCLARHLREGTPLPDASGS